MIWGSFLNVVGYRLIRGKSLIAPRSYCPHCKHTIAWYDNVPLVSYILLGGKCRNCKQRISLLYPFIELLTALVMTALIYFITSDYWFGYFLFFSALIVTIRSDFETMLISRYVTLFAIPIGWGLSLFGFLPNTILQSILGTLIGYSLLFAIAQIFYWFTKKEGMGQGDLELLAFIGAFTGPFGCWISLLLGSVIGSIFGIGTMIILKQTQNVRIPFGPFLAMGALIFVLLQDYFIALLI